MTRSIIFLGRVWLGVRLYPHEKRELDRLIAASGFRYTSHPTIIPTTIRYAMIHEARYYRPKNLRNSPFA